MSANASSANAFINATSGMTRGSVRGSPLLKPTAGFTTIEFFSSRMQRRASAYCVTTNILNVPATGTGRGCSGLDPAGNVRSAVGR